jgi:hypothetical protein
MFSKRFVARIATAPDGQPLGPAPSARYARAMCGRARLSSDVSEIKLVFPPDRPTPAERQRLSAFTRISILIIAADSRTIHSEYVGKATGPETMLVANRLLGHLPPGPKKTR